MGLEVRLVLLRFIKKDWLRDGFGSCLDEESTSCQVRQQLARAGKREDGERLGLVGRYRAGDEDGMKREGG